MSDSEYTKIVEAEKALPHFQKTIREPKALPLVYQYRDFNSFWKIIKSNAFWATNARFSNDEAEQQFGMDVISCMYAENGKDREKRTIVLDENYIVCFCRDDDKLSQWRGYASKGGVSMGFDFGAPRMFSVLRRDRDAEKPCTKKDCVQQCVGLDAVKYVPPRRDGQIDTDYGKECREQILLADGATPEDTPRIYHEEIRKKAPFIKHEGFREENECRLVFRNSDGQLDDCVRYRDNGDASLRYPYIVVKAALPESAVPSVVRVCIPEKENELAEKLSKILKAKHTSTVQGCHLAPGASADAGDSFCAGCVLRRWEDVSDYQLCRYQYPAGEVPYEFFLHENASCVLISQGTDQKEVFEIVHKQVQAFTEETGIPVSVWCEGHLPLRKITIGPCPNQQVMLEAIRHYCKHNYWLRDVEITLSKIPFRKAL